MVKYSVFTKYIAGTSIYEGIKSNTIVHSTEEAAAKEAIKLNEAYELGVKDENEKNERNNKPKNGEKAY